MWRHWRPLGSRERAAKAPASPSMKAHRFNGHYNGHKHSDGMVTATSTVTTTNTSSNNIQDVKAMIEGKEGIPPSDQSLFVRGKHLEDCCTLSDYEINEHTILHLHGGGADPNVSVIEETRRPSLLLENPSPVHQGLRRRHSSLKSYEDHDGQLDSGRVGEDMKFVLRIKTNTNKMLTLSVKSSNTVQDVKATIQCKEGIPPCDQRLICRGMQLEIHRTLGD
ncbi:hypothetical protein E2562_000457 [Oryza meyeriana var. granulata]|uniref:Ubiquitin-like domain-containing protein n=1 Tax=Oryza meyeriana var. granulata TaxID=110450 RepID=A0A6G1CAR7_9ORYZ|nr:hypothetical protein E2562_000457 [Oryza meyeriana var. granulata]